MGLDMYLTGDKFVPEHQDNLPRAKVDSYPVESQRLKMGRHYGMQPIGWKKMTTLGRPSNTTGVGDGRLCVRVQVQPQKTKKASA